MLKDDNRRLSISIGDRNFNVVDTLSGEQFVYDGNNITCSSLDVDAIKSHIESLQELLSLSKPNYFMHKPLGKCPDSKSVVIQEISHFSYKISCNGKYGILSDHKLDCQLGFDTTKVLNLINYVYSIVLKNILVLNPRTDIVRRVVDARLLVWVYHGNTAVCFEDDCIGQCMTNCLINGKHYAVVPLSVNEEKGVVSMFDGNFNLIAEFPIDNSVLVYFQDDSKLLDKEVNE